jgi:hypothetical protein
MATIEVIETREVTRSQVEGKEEEACITIYFNSSTVNVRHHGEPHRWIEVAEEWMITNQ